MNDSVDETADALLRVARRLRAATHAALAPLGLSPHQARALRIIGDSGPVRPSAIAAHLRIAPRSATEVLDALAERGWVARSADPADRRAALISLTESGRALAERVTELQRQESERLLGVLDADALRELGELLHRVERRSTGDLGSRPEAEPAGRDDSPTLPGH